MTLQLHLNGETRASRAAPMTPLLDVLRDEFHLTGAKPVCREGFCGACLVLIDGAPTLSCLTPAGLCEEAAIRTVEGLAPSGALSRVQQALEDADAVQCGMCFPGMVVTLTHLVEAGEPLDRDAVRHALVGNICRCTGYERIVDAAISLTRAE